MLETVFKYFDSRDCEPQFMTQKGSNLFPIFSHFKQNFPQQRSVCSRSDDTSIKRRVLSRFLALPYLYGLCYCSRIGNRIRFHRTGSNPLFKELRNNPCLGRTVYDTLFKFTVHTLISLSIKSFQAIKTSVNKSISSLASI